MHFYLSCRMCGLSYPLETTDEDERCACGDVLVIAGEPEPPRPFACRRCGQVMAVCDKCPVSVNAKSCPCGRALCAACDAFDREPQGEAMRLFVPAPSQIPGQLGLAAVSSPPTTSSPR